MPAPELIPHRDLPASSTARNLQNSVVRHPVVWTAGLIAVISIGWYLLPQREVRMA